MSLQADTLSLSVSAIERPAAPTKKKADAATR